jgi:hypothetical protein
VRGGPGVRVPHAAARRNAHGRHDRRDHHHVHPQHPGERFLAQLDDFLYLPEGLYVLILVWLIFSGPSRYSVDGLIALKGGVLGVER